MTAPAHTTPLAPEDQRDALLESERKANKDQPRNFREDALTDKVITVEPDGTGPTPTESFDAEQDKQRGSGSGSA
jgi:hypothetical protein